MYMTHTGSAVLDFSIERQRLLARDAEWSSAASAGQDVEKILSYWTDDAVVIPPGQPVIEGKAAITAFITASLRIPGFTIRWSSDAVTFSPDGQMACIRGTNITTVPGPGGALLTLHGRAVTVWRIDHDGEWRCTIDVWNEAPGPSPGS